MFWGLVLKANKRYSQQVTKAFHVSQATLDINTLSDDDAVIQVWVHSDNSDHLLANVSREHSSVQLDLAFTEGESVAFYSKGAGTVHLTGYVLPDDDDDFGGLGLGGAEDESEVEDEEDVEDDELPAANSNRKQKENKANKKLVAVDEEEDDDDSEDLDFDGLNDELENDLDGEEEEDSDEDDEDDDEEDDDDDEDDEDDDEEEEDEEEDEVQPPPAKHAKFDKAAKQNGLPNGKPAKNEQKQKQKSQQPEKAEQKQKNQQNQQQNQQQKPAQRTLAGGVVVEDIRVGKGPEAKSGRKVNVYYEGRLKSNNKVFDSTKSGKGFEFHLGRGEVIRGWDVGIVGMRVGSKRRLTIPASAGYGARGSPPAIPGGATLVFEVELRGVN